MTPPSGHRLVELLIETADRRDEDVLQVVTGAGIEPALRALFGELLSGERLSLRYDLDFGSTVVSHVVTASEAGVELSPGSSGPATGRRVEHSLLDFLQLYRAVFGARAAADGREFALRQLGESPRPVGPAARDGARHGELDGLAARFGTDKWGVHWYTPHYDRHFRGLRERPLRLLEIGIGGGEGHPGRAGASLRMWQSYFPRAMVFGIDHEPQPCVDDRRIRTFAGDQSDVTFLASVIEQTGPVDIVIDDGSHVSSDILTSFRALFPHVRPGGYYAIEDLQTSYWPGFGGSSEELSTPGTTVGYLKTLVDGLHHQELLRAGDHSTSDTDRHVVGLHFFHNLALVEKGTNAESGAWYLPDEFKRTGFPRARRRRDGAETAGSRP